MVKEFTQDSSVNVEWIDVLAPTPEELQTLAIRYGIHPAFIADVLQPEHLPKYEPIGENAFIILRYYSAGKKDKEADTIQELTNKIAIFFTEQRVITIHRKEAPMVDELKKELIDSGKCRGTFHLLNRLVKAVLFTYEAPAHKLAEEIDYYEARTFLRNKTPPILKGLYHVKRKVDVSKRLLLLTKEVLEKIDDPAHQDPDTGDTRDLFVRLLTLYEIMSENTNQLLNIYFSVSSQRVNEVIRVLTIFSVFFMPLTFIVGIYGMNFDFMPELRWKLAYPGVLLLMVGVTVAIYFWFRRKGWL